MAQEKIIDLLRKLMAQADGEKAVGNMAAAQAFAAKAQELLTKHKLEMSDIEFAAEELNEPVLGEEVSANDVMGLNYNYVKRKNDKWVGILLQAIAEANFCKVLRKRTGSNKFALVGRASDRQTTTTLYAYLIKACLEMAPREADMNDATGDNKRTFISSFKLGFACAISERLQVKRVELKAATSEQGLMRIDQLELATAKKFKEMFPNTVSCGGAKFYNRSGFEAGESYGSRVGINSTKRLGAGA
jgi:Protein of unknown function (DUF2786)